MGGRASGPRLKRHAPQADAHDPTQFIQQARPDAPHPIFGRGGIGGIALPGMTAKTSTPQVVDHSTTQSPPLLRTPESKERRRSTPSPEKPERSVVAGLVQQRVRERTLSTPGTKNSPIVVSQVSRTLSTTPSQSPKPLPSQPVNMRPTVSAPVTKSPVVTVPPPMARPIQPDVRASAYAATSKPLSAVSPAFSRTAAAKELTPSLSRLQGRGFVQDMVKKSTLPDSAVSTPSPEKSRPSSARKSSVLDRWPVAEPTPSPPPSPSPIRKFQTAPIPVKSAQLTMLKQPEAQPVIVKRVEPQPVMAEQVEAKPVTVKQLEDQPVMFKRTEAQPAIAKRFEAQPVMAKRPEAPPTVDEFGVKRTNDASRPLVHLTKDRAKKPRKNKDVSPDTTASKASDVQETKPSVVLRTPKPDAQEHKSPVVLITHKPVSAPSAPTIEEPRKIPSGIRRALPGMTAGAGAFLATKSPAPQSSPAAAPRALPGLASTDSAPFHSRVPSSGNRPTVMDVAQAFAEPKNVIEEKPIEPPAARARVAVPASSERRKSSYDRYSTILPPLKEEATPDPTPHSTLTRKVPVAEALADLSAVTKKLKHLDPPLPRVDISCLRNYVSPAPAGIQTIQVDVLSISGSSAAPLGLVQTFYDTEVLAIIHRSKSSATGLIESRVWSWQGKNSILGSPEERKLAELAKRYGTVTVPTFQNAEPLELVQCLGRQLIVRQASCLCHMDLQVLNLPFDLGEQIALGQGEHCDAYRPSQGWSCRIFIDQVDIDIRNICSGFSYCVSILETVYVWHGRGSTPPERTAAEAYGKTLTADGAEILILEEEQSDDDDMFWMALGEDRLYAQADYWRWKPTVAGSDPRIWTIDAEAESPITPVASLFDNQSSVYLVDCLFEFYILVSRDARAKRQDIRLALSVASDAAKNVAADRPYAPTIHVLVLPSQLPLDLRVQFRDLDAFSDSTEGVDHMNLLTVEEANSHLQTTSWPKIQLQDISMLPLGVSPSHIR
ncbi:unnamed protein product [Mycena citricolor]|uniref:Uncharacterized protein n=1 Tax=Mycena citricolor TaxID=2018698 RepID=A0AAD2K6E9_9AGAR|nr:unnamed protein product [Mycena citricolor]